MKEKDFDLIEMLRGELDKLASEKELNTFDKIVYIYYRLCQIFNYDERWYTFDDDEKFIQELYDKEVNPHQVDDTTLLCSSFSTVCEDVYNELLDLEDNFLNATVEELYSHCSVLLTLFDCYLVVDPILEAQDFLNAKKGFDLKGLTIDCNSYIDESDFEEKLQLALCKTGYYNHIGYLDYLNMVREELKKIAKANHDEFPNKEMGINYMDYFANAVKVGNLGIFEIDQLLNVEYLTLFGASPSWFGIKRSVINDDEKKESSYLYTIYDSDKKYLVHRVDGKAIIETIDQEKVKTLKK